MLHNQATGKTIYTPPVGKELIAKLLGNLEGYMGRDDGVDPLIRMAVIHHQFESIHPFYDGNGRTGRILNILYLVKSGLLDLPVLSIAREIIEHKDDYYRLLQELRAKMMWQDWILFMLKAVERSSHHTLRLVMSIRELLNSTMRTCRAKLPAPRTPRNSWSGSSFSPT